jgi:hypothetical protein
MPARFSAFVPDAAALTRLLDDDRTYRIGRAAECELVLEHATISRHHAELRRGPDGWQLRDCGSKNGVRVDGERIPSRVIGDGCWFAIGDVYCSLETLDAAAAARQRDDEIRRRAISLQLSQRLALAPEIGALLPLALDAVLELSGLERGFVLYADADAALRVHARRGLNAADLAGAGFSGSAAAVERALASRQCVVCCDTDAAPWLGLRPSVRLGGIRAIVCVPLLTQDAALGLIYADSRKPGPAITDLDLELIQNAAGQAAAALAAQRLNHAITGLLEQAAAAGVDAPRWDELRA